MKNKEKIDEIKGNVNNWLYDHQWAKNTIDYVWAFIVCTLSALVFCFGFNAFMDLGTKVTDNSGNELVKIVAGGVSGISQVLTLIFELCGWHSTTEGGTLDEHLSYSILYFVMNIPLIILAWKGIGKRFTVFTLINVAEVSLFMKLLTIDQMPWIQEIAKFVANNGSLLARALFAGVCTGLSSALAFKEDFSAGGIDILAYYIALKKNTLVGKYSVMLNSVTVVCFTLLTSAKANWALATTASAFGRLFYSVLYMLAGMLVVDFINVRNKKMKLEVVTSRKDLGDVLVAAIPHAATMIPAKGVYTGADRYIFVMVVSSYEVNEALKIVQKEDPSSFVQVIQLTRVQGRFHMKPVK